jgi:hypothetical protein
MRKLVAASVLTLGLISLPTAAHAGGSTWLVGIKASATTINVGQKVTFTGKVRPGSAAAGKKVTLQERFKPGAPWRDSAKAKINGKGKYSVFDQPNHNTTHSYRVVMAANSKHPKGVSKTVEVTVYDWVSLITLGSVNSNGMSFGSVDINGTSYDDSVASWRSGGSSSVEFNLDHQCDKLRSTFGISDGSTTGGQAEVGVLSDGTSVYDKIFDLGQSETKVVPLDRPLKIKLLADDTSTGTGVFGLGAFGSPEAHCTQ